MTTSTVLGLDQADIATAVTAAGENGTVFFPNGVYPVSGLQITVPNQTWELERGAVIKRSSANLIMQIMAPGLRIRGGTLDGNRASDTYSGIYGTGTASLDMEGVTLQNVAQWGLMLDGGGALSLRRCKFKNIGFSPIFWSSTAWATDGPLIDNCLIDRYTGFTSQSGINIRTATKNTSWVRAPRVINTTVLMPEVPNLASTGTGQPHENSVGIEILNAVDALVQGCSVTYSKIGISFGNSRNGKMIANGVSTAFQYGLEVADGSFGNNLLGNSVSSVCGQAIGSAAPSRGVSISGASVSTRVIGNSLYWNTVNVGANGDSTGTVDQFNG